MNQALMILTDYRCPKCQKTHRVLSKIGQAHLEHVTLPKGNYRWEEKKDGAALAAYDAARKGEADG